MATLCFPDDAHQAAEAHLESYTAHFHSCVDKLTSIWKQVGKAPDECRSQVLLAAEQALAAWSQAVEQAETERQTIKALIQQHSGEIASIKAELDDGADQASEADANIPIEGEATLERTLDALRGTLQFWRIKRASRMQAYEALMDLHISLKQQLGEQHLPVAEVDISTQALEYLQMENNKLREEKARRMARAEELLDRLRGICRELGEDSAAAAAEVHPALSSLSAEKESAEVLGSVYRLAASSPHAADLAGGGDVDLSDATFDRLAAKIGEMEKLKVEREAQCRDVLEMLISLWGALRIPEDAPERSMVLKLMSADRPQRLYKRTLDKGLAEVNRLEGCKAQAMQDLALAKARELEQLCISTRISPPHTGPLLAELDKPGQMTQVLSKLVRLVAEVQAMVAKRAPILQQVLELLQAQADSAWLRAYNQNENRYKGRDASRNMQRAIKAAKLRERLGPMMEGLLTALAEWELEEGSPFLYDEQVLQDTHLKAVEAELEQLALEKVPKARSSTTSLSASMSTSTFGAMTSASSASSKPPAVRGTPSGSMTQRGSVISSSRVSSAASVASEDRPLVSARQQAGGDSSGGGGGSSRRGSFGFASASARDCGVYRPSSMATSLLSQKSGRLLRSNDFISGTLRAVTEDAERAGMNAAKGNITPQGKAMHGSAVPLAATPGMPTQTPGKRPPVISVTSPVRPATSAPAAAASTPAASKGAPVAAADGSGGAVDSIALGGNGSALKNTAQDLFRRYLGDPSDAPKPTPFPATATKTPPSATAASRRPPTSGGSARTHTGSKVTTGGSKLLFPVSASASAAPSSATAAAAGQPMLTTNTATPEDDGTDDVIRDTPKSTATSRSHHLHYQQQQQQMVGGGGIVSPQGPAALKSPVERTSRIPRVR